MQWGNTRRKVYIQLYFLRLTLHLNFRIMKKIIKALIRSKVGRIILSEIFQIFVTNIEAKAKEKLPTEFHPVIDTLVSELKDETLNEIIDGI